MAGGKSGKSGKSSKSGGSGSSSSSSGHRHHHSGHSSGHHHHSSSSRSSRHQGGSPSGADASGSGDVPSSQAGADPEFSYHRVDSGYAAEPLTSGDGASENLEFSNRRVDSGFDELTSYESAAYEYDDVSYAQGSTPGVAAYNYDDVFYDQGSTPGVAAYNYADVPYAQHTSPTVPAPAVQIEVRANLAESYNLGDTLPDVTVLVPPGANIQHLTAALGEGDALPDAPIPVVPYQQQPEETRDESGSSHRAFVFKGLQSTRAGYFNVTIVPIGGLIYTDDYPEGYMETIQSGSTTSFTVKDHEN
ncbi:hypothetical protein F4780DRAFT_783363 [Xylariomycetidae sp. FL0641]|nr:hypothetical protein F4780DRAFT_783363 [Xylariomycetidae sp. FL0641]